MINLNNNYNVSASNQIFTLSATSSTHTIHTALSSSLNNEKIKQLILSVFQQNELLKPAEIRKRLELYHKTIISVSRLSKLLGQLRVAQAIYKPNRCSRERSQYAIYPSSSAGGSEVLQTTKEKKNIPLILSVFQPIKYLTFAEIDSRITLLHRIIMGERALRKHLSRLIRDQAIHTDPDARGKNTRYALGPSPLSSPILPAIPLPPILPTIPLILSGSSGLSESSVPVIPLSNSVTDVNQYLNGGYWDANIQNAEQ